MSRRPHAWCALAFGVLYCLSCQSLPSGPARPNVILLMADDMGWGDFGPGATTLTPQLDAMAHSGLTFHRFYAAAPVCSPTRGSALTGRHPSRYGVSGANAGHLPAEEHTLAEYLKEVGYATGHFGKWHLGTLTTKKKDSNRGGPGKTSHYSPPWEHGFDVCFSTEAKVPTYDPMVDPGTGEPYGTAYWTGPGEEVLDGLEGDDSALIMDRALEFIQESTEEGRPFFAVVWFHAPHKPVVAGPEHLARHPDRKGSAQHYRGCLSAMDDQVGRLRAALRECGVADETMVWFTSDNGPEGSNNTLGTTRGLRGRKRSLFEGGVRVPGILEWPDRVTAGETTSVPSVTSDYLPTVLSLLGLEVRDERPIDGVDLSPLLGGERVPRSQAIGFHSGGRQAWIDGHYKIVRNNKGKPFGLFELSVDPEEAVDLSGEDSARAEEMMSALARWRSSCESSAAGEDYR